MLLASWVLRCASYSALEMLLKMWEEDCVMVVLVLGLVARRKALDMTAHEEGALGAEGQ